MSSAAISSWKLPDTNITSYFILKILNRHHPEWKHGEDIRSLTKVPEAKWISEGKGFSSKIYSIKITVQEKVYQFCVKIPSIFHLEAGISADAENEANVQEQKSEACKVIAQTHSRELVFYRMATVYFKSLKVPKFIYGHEWTNDQKGIIIMEDFTNECEPTFCAQKSFSHDQILALIDQTVILQTSSLENEKLENDFPLLLNTVYTISRYAQLSIEILLTRNLDFFTEEIAEKLSDLAHPEMLEQILVRCDDLFPVLVHSAIWSGNVLWSSKNNSQLLSIIDWQGCFAGSPTADLAAILAISVTAEERQKREDEYLKYYVEKFNEFRDKDKIITALDFDTVKESYGRSLLYSMIELIVVIISNPLDDVIEDGEAYGIMTKRLKALIEDLLLD